LGFSLKVYNDDKEIACMYWLRNPFGFGRWVWNATGINVDNMLDNRQTETLLQMLIQNLQQIEIMEDGYLYFSNDEYKQFNLANMVEQNKVEQNKVGSVYRLVHFHQITYHWLRTKHNIIS
jgi:hypothetical protein